MTQTSSKRFFGKRLTACIVAASFATVGTVQTVQAAVIGTDAVVAAQKAPVGTVQVQLHAMLNRSEAVEALQARGVDVRAAQLRIASLSDAEAAELLAQIDSAPAGGVNALAVVAGVVVVLMITDLLGFTRIFPFIKPIR
jgi:hypothetical protein